MASLRSLTPPASFDTAFRRLRDQVSPHDEHLFSSTTMEDVRKAALEIEDQLQQRRTLRGFVRIRPFLNGIEQYSGVVEVLCQGTPYLPFLWAPIKLFLQIAQGHIAALESLIDAYAMIGEAMPRFDKLSAAFAEDSDFQQILGMFYADILDFHRRAYKFFRRRSWTILFESLWRTFSSRFESILQNLRRHRDLVDREAAAIDIAQAKEWRGEFRQWRTKLAEQDDRSENDRRKTQLREAVAWLGARDEQEDEFSRLSDACVSKHWALEHPKVLSWLDQNRCNGILWLNGKPGAGKSVICSKIIEHLQSDDNNKIIYYFCRHDQATQYPATDILKEFATQLLAANQELAPYILGTFANNGLKPAKKYLTIIVDTLIAALPSVRVIVDGLDELPRSAQEGVIKDLLTLKGPPAGACKLLISSQCSSTITKTLGNKPQLRLEDCSESVDATIATFIKPRMDELRQIFDPSIVDGLKLKILEKAQGMFLWVRLVVWTLEDIYLISQLQDAIEELPESLNELYEKILLRICGNGTEPKQRIALRILQWLLVAKRPLRRAELEAGISLDAGTPRITANTKARGDPLSQCAPIIHCEGGLSGKVRFFHFTAEKFLSGCAAYADLQLQAAHHAVSLSCSLYLHSAFDLIDPHISKLVAYEEILLGFHDLHVYANDYLLEHLGSLALDKAVVPWNDTLALRTSLERLSVKHFDLSQPEDRGSRSVASDDQHRGTSPWDSFGIPSHAQALLNDLNNFREATVSKAAEIVVEASTDLRADSAIRSIAKDNFKASSGIKEDPTLFSTLRKRYQDIVEDLLQQNPTNHARLKDFQIRNNAGRFLCSFQGCPRASEGFDTLDLRQQHEDRHNPLFKCTERSCGLLGWTCKNRRDWKRHEVKYHEKQAEIPFSLEVPRDSYDRGGATTPTPSTPIRPAPQTQSMPLLPDLLQNTEPSKCICRFDYGAISSVRCGICLTWQHTDCYYHNDHYNRPPRQEELDRIVSHLCIDCHMRPIDCDGALMRQKERRYGDGSLKLTAKLPPEKLIYSTTRTPTSAGPQAISTAHLDTNSSSIAENLDPSRPEWLMNSLNQVHQSYPNDSFGGFLTTFLEPLYDFPELTSERPSGYQFHIQCFDCPPGRQFATSLRIGIPGFKSHLDSITHIWNRKAKLKRQVQIETGGISQRDKHA